MPTDTDTDKKRKREDYATNCYREREDQLADIKRPTRGSKELAETRKAAKSLQLYLRVCDGMETTPPFADDAKALFNELVAHIVELSTPAPKPE